MANDPFARQVMGAMGAASNAGGYSPSGGDLAAAYAAFHPAPKQSKQFGGGQDWLGQSKKKGGGNQAAALMAAWNAYHPHPTQAPLHGGQPFAGIPGIAPPNAPSGAYSKEAQAFYNALPKPASGAFGGPKVIGGPDPAAAFPLTAPRPPGAKPPSKKEVSTLQGAVHQNQIQAFNQAVQQNQNPDNPTGNQVSDPNAPTPGQAVLGAVARDEGLSPQELENVRRGMARESSGGHNEWQGNIGDVNNASGDLAFGPLQIIQKTFDAHADPGWSRMNPYYSMRAAIRYARDRYGPNWSQVMASHGY